jgi:indole-3-glycerol phosphate synthase/phosphoribosylanthranilate isomerase
VQILEKIVANKKREIANLPKVPASISNSNFGKFESRDFFCAISGRENLKLIAEIKKKSPSRAAIFRGKNFDAAKLAKEFETAGAAAISVLTDREFFGGSFSNLTAAKNSTKKIPILAKDFFISRRQIFAAKSAGADAVLLIARILDEKKLRELFEFAQKLNLTAVVEVFDETDCEKLQNCGAKIVGINSRNLETFAENCGRIFKIARQIPDRNLIAMSGFFGAETQILSVKFDAVLAGTAICGAENPAAKITEILRPKKLVKFCGIRNLKSAEFCEKNGVDFVGFNFVEKSRRKIEISAAQKLRLIFQKTKTVGVFADLNFEKVAEICEKLNLNFAQFHGDEPPEFCEKLPIATIRAFKISANFDWQILRKFEKSCDFFLFDGENPGAGESFDWKILVKFLEREKFAEKFFIAGGISAKNCAEVLRRFSKFKNFLGVDTASGIEFENEFSADRATEILEKIRDSKVNLGN